MRAIAWIFLIAAVAAWGAELLYSLQGGQYRFLQLGAYGTEASARQLQAELQGFVQSPVFISEVESGGKLLSRVRVGPVADADELALVQQQLRDGGVPNYFGEQRFGHGGANVYKAAAMFGGRKVKDRNKRGIYHYRMAGFCTKRSGLPIRTQAVE